MFSVATILQQATEILNGASVAEAAGTFDAGQAIEGAGPDSEFIGSLPLDDPNALFSQFGLDEGLPFDPSVLSAASDVLSGRGG